MFDSHDFLQACEIFMIIRLPSTPLKKRLMNLPFNRIYPIYTTEISVNDISILHSDNSIRS